MTADEEEDDGGDNNQPAVNTKSHLDENNYDHYDDYDNDDDFGNNYVDDNGDDGQSQIPPKRKRCLLRKLS